MCRGGWRVIVRGLASSVWSSAVGWPLWRDSLVTKSSSHVSQSRTSAEAFCLPAFLSLTNSNAAIAHSALSLDNFCAFVGIIYSLPIAYFWFIVFHFETWLETSGSQSRVSEIQRSAVLSLNSPRISSNLFLHATQHPLSLLKISLVGQMCGELLITMAVKWWDLWNRTMWNASQPKPPALQK
mgnify:CR=1 FL=1